MYVLPHTRIHAYNYTADSQARDIRSYIPLLGTAQQQGKSPNIHVHVWSKDNPKCEVTYLPTSHLDS